MEKEISRATLKRLPTYLAYLKGMPESSGINISATALAAGLHMGEVQVRKDLALVSSGGRPKIGYNRAALVADIEQFLGYGNTNDAVLIGAGKLGRALLGDENVALREAPSMGGEDFSYFCAEAPGAFYHLGCASQQPAAPLHSRDFQLDERCLPIGCAMQCALALDRLNETL